MTLNVIVNNMVAVDSEVSHHGARTTDNYEKSTIINANNYHGIIIGNGSGITLLDAISHAERAEYTTLAELAEGIKNNLALSWDNKYEHSIKILKKFLEEKYQLISDAQKREEYIMSEFIKEVDRMQQDFRNPNGSIYIVGKSSQSEMSMYHIPDMKSPFESKMDKQRIIVDGSGGDLAGAYLSTSTSGINWDQITPAYNFYFVSLACAAATANSGVGGIMKVAIVGDKKTEYVDAEKVNAAVRVCGKQIAGNIGKLRAIKLVKDVFSERIPDYTTVVRALGMKRDDLLYSPCSLHQDVTRFNLQQQN